MYVQTLYSLQAYIITVLVGPIVRYLWRSIFGVRISGIPTVYEIHTISNPKLSAVMLIKAS